MKKPKRIIFSRKGFDSKNGRGPSPIIDGQPVSLPIPNDSYPQGTPYGRINVNVKGRDLNLGDIVEEATKRRKKKYTANSLCHEDPMFNDGRCAFGQAGGAQTQLKNNNVAEGDVFLFFGLFNYPGRGSSRHHRIFGYLEIKKIELLDSPSEENQPAGFLRRHPHTIPGKWPPHNTLYTGEGYAARTDDELLRLTCHKRTSRYWRVPSWLQEADLSGQENNCWEDTGNPNQAILRSACIGQEFVTDLGNLSDAGREKARLWLDEILAAIEAPPHPK